MINLVVDNVAIRSVLDSFGKYSRLSRRPPVNAHQQVSVVILTPALLIFAQSVARVRGPMETTVAIVQDLCQHTCVRVGVE